MVTTTGTDWPNCGGMRVGAGGSSGGLGVVAAAAVQCIFAKL